jgi:hypothetical protein
VAIPQGDRADPWPFVAMIGMAFSFFLYAASGLLAPWWGVALLLLVWVALFVVATRWWTPHPKRTLLLPLIAIVVWFGVLFAGEALFSWTA